MTLVVTTQPASEPVTLDETKTHLRVTDTSEDTLIGGLITAAREYAELVTGRAFITRAYTLTLPATATITLPFPYLVAVTAVTYTLPGDVDHPLGYEINAAYTVNAFPSQAVVTIDPLPVQAVTVKVCYTAGFGTAATSVPRTLRQALLLLVGHWYTNRETTGARTTDLPYAVDILLNMHRVTW